MNGKSYAVMLTRRNGFALHAGGCSENRTTFMTNGKAMRNTGTHKIPHARHTLVLLTLTCLIVAGGLARAKQIQKGIQVTGTWDGEFSGTVERTGTSQTDSFVMELKQEGTKVTGTLRFKGLDMDFPLSGKVIGTTFTYTSKAKLSPDCEASIAAETILDESSGKFNGSQTQRNCEGTAVGQVTAVRR